MLVTDTPPPSERSVSRDTVTAVEPAVVSPAAVLCTTRQIPSLNGLRALSILLVIIGHVDQKQLNGVIYASFPMLLDPQFGVNVFFVLSGFLITTLLLQEERDKRDVSLKGFYLRRALRILPLYYLLLLVYFALQVLNVLHFTSLSWLTSLTYTKDFYRRDDWETAHLWSLSVEEQFYLMWPLVFKFARPIRKHFAFFIIGLAPMMRLLYLRTAYPWMDELTIFQRLDAIMWGCVFAMYHDRLLEYCKAITVRYSKAIWLPFIAIIALSLTTILNRDLHLNLGYAITAFGGTSGTIADVAIGLIIVTSIHYTRTGWYRFLNANAMNRVGELSYSLYIWQQLFFSAALGSASRLPVNILLIFGVANVSYFLVEKPILKLRRKLRDEALPRASVR
jgi:peptidoglycan/LPS O-acetylase OafA/YrhL